MKLLISLAILLQVVGCVGNNQLQSSNARNADSANLVTSNSRTPPPPSHSAAHSNSTDSPLIIDHELSGKVTLTNEWLELIPKDPLKVERNTQEVTLFPDPPIKMVDDPTGQRSLIPADGRDATIEVELIDTNGMKYQSRPGYSRSMTGDLYVTSHSVDFKYLPKDVGFAKVRIRSSAKYPVKKILWRCYNWSDVHH
jgi:hypothetical protein